MTTTGESSTSGNTARGIPSASIPTGGTSTATALPSASSTQRAGDWRTGPTVAGLDVSRYQPFVAWTSLWAAGHRFVWVKATEGTTHISPTYAAQSAGAWAAGFLVGGYHYARPASSSGATQARHFLAHGGGWSADGRTLPGALDLEASTSGDRCHGLTRARLASWIRDFSATYRLGTGRPPVVYVSARMWDECVADPGLAAAHPLWLFDHDDGFGPLPTGWSRPIAWQRGVEANLDRNVFFGTESDLRNWARMP